MPRRRQTPAPSPPPKPPSPRMGRPLSDELTTNPAGFVRPHMLVQTSTVDWLTQRGGGHKHRVTALTQLLADRYALPVAHRPPLEKQPEGEEPFRPFVMPQFLAAIDAERGAMTRGQVVDAIVRLAADTTVDIAKVLAQLTSAQKHPGAE